MKSTRITKVQGTFMGIPFQVKPVPIDASEIEAEQRKMLMGWYAENHPSVHEKLEKDLDVEEFTTEDLNAIGSWKKDVEFRSKYLKFMAESCMDFERAVPEENWSSGSLPYSTIKESWDFFTERRIA